MIVPLCPHYQPKTKLKVKLDTDGMLRSKWRMEQTINSLRRKAPGFDLMPVTHDTYEIYLYTAGAKMACKVCPETDCAEINPVGEPEIMSLRSSTS